MISARSIMEGAAHGFTAHGQAFFAIRHNDALWVYKNQCPHLGITLEWEPHQFVDHDTDLIRCSTHGALFEPAGGLCVSGPCRGKHLQSVPFRLDPDGHIEVITDSGLDSH